MLDLDREADEPRAAYEAFKDALRAVDQAIGDLIAAAHKAGLDPDIDTLVNEFQELWGEHHA